MPWESARQATGEQGGPGQANPRVPTEPSESGPRQEATGQAAQATSEGGSEFRSARNDDGGPHPAAVAPEEASAVAPDTTRLIKDLFGGWTREEADRSAARTQMITTHIREEIKSDFAKISSDIREAMVDQRRTFEESVDEKLRTFAHHDDLRKLSDRVDVLSDKVRSFGIGRVPQPQTAHTRPAPPAHQPYLHPTRVENDGLSERDEQVAAPVDLDPAQYPSHQTGEDSTVTKSVPATLTSRWLGPHEEGLVELLPADDRFTMALSYRRYRLHNRGSVLNSDVTRNLGKWQRRLSHRMAERNMFSGTRPVAILNFLAAYKNALDGEFIPEVAGLVLMHHYLYGEALTLFETMMNDAGAESAGFASWPHAVQFLLETYATDLNIEKAIDDLERIRLDPKETISQFKTRLTRAARELAGAYSQDALITRFIRNLPANIRDIVRLELPKHKRRADASYAPATLNRIAAFAEAHHRAHGGAPAARPSPRFRPDPVSHVDGLRVDEHPPESREDDLPPLPRAAAQRPSDPFVAAVHTDDDPGRAGPAPPSLSDHTRTTEYSARGSAAHEPVSGQFVEQVHAVDQRRFPARTPPRGQRQPTSSIIPAVCFVCFLSGHLSTNCPHRHRAMHDAGFQAWALSNFRKLQVWQQHWLQSINRLPASFSPNDAKALAAAHTVPSYDTCVPAPPLTPTDPRPAQAQAPTQPRQVLQRPQSQEN